MDDGQLPITIPFSLFCFFFILLFRHTFAPLLHALTPFSPPQAPIDRPRGPLSESTDMTTRQNRLTTLSSFAEGAGGEQAESLSRGFCVHLCLCLCVCFLLPLLAWFWIGRSGRDDIQDGYRVTVPPRKHQQNIRWEVTLRLSDPKKTWQDQFCKGYGRAREDKESKQGAGNRVKRTGCRVQGTS